MRIEDIEIRENGLGKFQVWHRRSNRVLQPNSYTWEGEHQRVHSFMYFDSRGEAIRQAKKVLSKNEITKILSLEDSVKLEMESNKDEPIGLFNRLFGI